MHLVAVQASRARPVHPGKWRVLSTGAPVLSEALGVLDCVVEEILERGGIVIDTGRIVAVASRADGDPLTFFRGMSHAGLAAFG
jgi:flavin reductase (DIM6/NTAB) family NADH-FMN oxidoreductase RutF